MPRNFGGGPVLLRLLGADVEDLAQGWQADDHLVAPGSSQVLDPYLDERTTEPIFLGPRLATALLHDR